MRETALFLSELMSLTLKTTALGAGVIAAVSLLCLAVLRQW